MRGKKIVCVLCVCCLLSIAALQAALAATPALPEIPGWQNGEYKVVGLDTVSGNHGFWAERTYRTSDGAPFKATWMGGKGPDFLYPPTSGLMSDDGPIGAGATYETLLIDGDLAILEAHPTLGLSIAVVLLDGVLTLESDLYGMEREQIEEAAVTLARQIKLTTPL